MAIEVIVPVMGGLACLGTVLCAVCMCAAKCPNYCERRRNRQARERLIQNCTKICYKKEDTVHHFQNETCPICLDDFQEKECVTVCPCRHGYHKDCLIDWLQNTPSCPVCKADVLEPAADEREPLLP